MSISSSNASFCVHLHEASQSARSSNSCLFQLNKQVIDCIICNSRLMMTSSETKQIITNSLLSSTFWRKRALFAEATVLPPRRLQQKGRRQRLVMNKQKRSSHVHQRVATNRRHYVVTNKQHFGFVMQIWNASLRMQCFVTGEVFLSRWR